jgi:hypothetical protein
MNNTLHKGPFPLEIIKSDDKFIVITNHGTHYSTTYDPSAAHLISAAPDLLSALETCVSELNQLAFIQKDKMAGVAIQKAFDAIAKAKGEI